jgi:hypothetical protein
MYCRILNDDGDTVATLNMTSPSSVHSISSGSSGSTVTFSDPNNDYIIHEGEYIMIEYDDGEDEFHFEMNQQSSGGTSAHANEAYKDGDDNLVDTDKDMGATIYGERT